MRIFEGLGLAHSSNESFEICPIELCTCDCAPCGVDRWRDGILRTSRSGRIDLSQLAVEVSPRLFRLAFQLQPLRPRLVILLALQQLVETFCELFESAAQPDEEFESFDALSLLRLILRTLYADDEVL